MKTKKIGEIFKHSVELSFWERSPELKDAMDTTLNELNDIFPWNVEENGELVENLIEEINSTVMGYFPKCLVGRKLKIYADGDTELGTASPEDIVVVQKIEVKYKEVFKEEMEMLVYVQTKEGLDHTRYFVWDKVKPYITIMR